MIFSWDHLTIKKDRKKKKTKFLDFASEEVVGYLNASLLCYWWITCVSKIDL